MTAAELAAKVVEAFTGDPEDLADAFAVDGILVDQPGDPPIEGTAAILSHFMAYGGGRREVAVVHDVFLIADRGGLAYSVWFRADAHAYGQHGRVLLTLDEEGLITRWDGAWIELESDLSPWGGD